MSERKAGRVGFIASAFDLCHAGHLLTLRECREKCDWLIVGLQIDPSSQRSFKNKPIETVFERYLRLDQNENVDKIIPYETEHDLYVLMQSEKIDVIFLGEDYKKVADYTAKKLPTPKSFCKRYDGYSSSKLRQRILTAEQKK